MILIPLLAFGGKWVFLILALALVGVSLYEYLSLVVPEEDWRGKWPVILIGLILPISAQRGVLSLSFGLAVVTILNFIFHMLREDEFVGIMARIGKASFGLLYVGFFLSHLVLIRGLASGSAWIFFLLFVIFLGDTSAFYVGKNYGRHGLYRKVSPGKTVEGAIAGFAASLLGALFFWSLFLRPFSFVHCVVLASGMSLLGQAGDLCESMIKRSAGVKDSGSILPGHGGMLDRIDGLFFAAPFLYYYVVLVL